MDTTLLANLSKDRALAQAMLFTHRHRQATPPFHLSIIDLWRAADPYVSIEAFREGAKTTLSEEFLVMEALFMNFKYALIFGETYTKACQRITAIKHELTTNPVIIKLFGPQRKATNAWSENKIILSNGTLLEAHGWEEEIRGYKHLDNRPDRAYLDDIETKERVRDSATVDIHWKKIHLELMPAMDKDLGKIRMTGTPLADDCLLTRARNSKHWTCGRFPICDSEFTTSLWPERYPIEWIKAKHDHYSEEGLLREFMQEYMLVAEGAQGKPFDETMLRYEDVAPSTYAPRAVIIDPARTVEVKTSDQTGHVTVSRLGTRIYVHESGADYWQPNEIVAGAFDLSARADQCPVFIEKNSLDDWLMQPIRAHALLTGQHMEVNPLAAPQDRDKTAFIMGLQSFFKAGDIIFVGGRSYHKKLISQILNFPSGKKDALNALAYVLRVFAGIPVYAEFGQVNIVSNYVPERTDVLALACNATTSETTAMLVAVHGRSFVVLAEWISDLMPSDAIPDIAALVRVAYPGWRLTSWVPADVLDQVGRNPLAAALTAVGLPPSKGEHTNMARQALSPLIRTELHGRRMLRVADTARATLAALSGNYRYQLRSGGERAPEPQRGSARTLIEGLECLTEPLTKINVAGNAFANNAVNVNGVPYMSAISNG